MEYDFFFKNDYYKVTDASLYGGGTCAVISGCQAAVLDVSFGSSPEADSTHELCLSFTSA